MIVKTTNKEIENMVLKASIKLLNEGSLYGYLLLRVPIAIGDYGYSGQIFTNGKSIFLDVGKEDKGLEGIKTTISHFGIDKVLKHELLHIVLNHAQREKAHSSGRSDIQRDEYLIAGDYLINKELQIKGNGYVDSDFLMQRYKVSEQDLEEIGKWNFEAIAQYLTKKLPKGNGGGGKSGKQGGSQGNGGQGGSQQGQNQQNNNKKGGGKGQNNQKEQEENEEEQQDQQENQEHKPHSNDFKDIHNHIHEEVKDKEIEQSIEQELSEKGYKDYSELMTEMIRSAVTRQAGKELTDLWKELGNIVFKHRVKWDRILKSRINSFKTSQDQDGDKLVNRRYHNLKAFMPRMPIPFNFKKQVYDKIHIAIDTSGSVSDEEYKRQLGEILTLFKNEKLNGEVMLFTADIEKTYAFDETTKPADILKALKERNTGGTSFEPLFKNAKDKRAKLLIIFSDLYASYPDETKYGFKTIMLTETSEKSVIKQAEKYGEVINIGE